jgi:hypothetical protein
MLDTAAVNRLVEQHIKEQVDQQVAIVLESEEWLTSFEQRIVEFVQSRVIAKFCNEEALPEITDTVKSSVSALFKNGMIPGIDQYVDPVSIRQSIDIAVEQLVDNAIAQLGNDPEWVAKIERQINQSMIDRVMRQLSMIDINPVIKQHVNENMKVFQQDILKNFESTGINDQATSCQLTVMDDATVIENRLTSRDLEIVNVAVIKDLVVKGSINIDNQSWEILSNGISEKTLANLTDKWKDSLTAQVKEQITNQGINFDTVTINGELLVAGNTLSKNILNTNIQQVGILKNLEVSGESKFNNQTLNVLNKRLGINTETPEKALSIWDEEVSIVIGKHKINQAYVGTNRDQGIAIGVNRQPQIEISAEGLTTIKRLQVGLHKISHDTMVPGWAGTKGDIVFNTNFGSDRVFAWMCIGGHRWETIRSS